MTTMKLYQKGYTIAQAARAIGRSTGHVRRVLTGERVSKDVINALRALPKRTLQMRRRVEAAEIA